MLLIFRKAVKWLKIYFCRYLNIVSPRNNPRYRNRPDIISCGPRAVQRQYFVGDRPYLTKRFINTPEAWSCFQNEKRAHKIFGNYPWFVPWVKSGGTAFTVPYYPLGSTLNCIGPHLSRRTQLRSAGQVLEIVLDLYIEGYAHRDLRANNLMFIDNQIKLIDFEYLMEYKGHGRGPFTSHYDIIAKGLPAPERCNSICFCSPAPDSVSSVLNVHFEEALEELAELLREKLLIASYSFHNFRDGRRSKRNKVYGSFDLGRFVVRPEDALRNTDLRLRQLEISKSAVNHKTVLNLGSNTGALSFETHKLNAARSLGVEFDYDKVQIARKIAAFCDLENIAFIRADIDLLKTEAIGGPYDIVLCLALEEHVKDKPRLFNLLGSITKEVLYYEGAAYEHLSEEAKIKNGTDNLLRAGFRTVEYLGLCTDDCNPAFNIRPVFRARR